MRRNKLKGKKSKMFKFDMKQTVYLLSNNKVVQGQIIHRCYTEDLPSEGLSSIGIRYRVRESENNTILHYDMYESQLFATKEELIKSL